MRTILAAALLVASALPSHSLDIKDYPEYRATWSLNCIDPAADNVWVDFNAIIVTYKGNRHTYRGIDVSHAFGGGAPTSNLEGYVWLLVSDQPEGDIKFVAQVPGHKRKGRMMIDAAFGDAKELMPLDGKKFQKCPAR